MIEWIVGAGVALLAGKLFGSEDKNGFAAALKSASSPSPGGAAIFAENLRQWRSQWEADVYKERWIPKGAAARIVARFPPPARSLDMVLGSPADRVRQELLIEFAAHNVKFLADQKERLKAFFETVEREPLTDEQIDACVCMDDAVQVVAAAGSGKTSTMVAKAGYALHEALAEPKQILLLAFNRDAARELEKRVRTRFSTLEGVDQITAKTFSAFGLSVIAKATNKKPSLAPWVEDPGRDVAKIVEIVDKLSKAEPKFRNEWDVFRTIYGRDLAGWSETPTSQPKHGSGKASIITANGEFVKSDEERLIADWLFYNGVCYVYERNYEYDTATDAHQQYRPDFYYPDAQLYHEHFALNREGKPPPHFEGDYLAGVRWKRQLHIDQGTALFETTSHQIRTSDPFSHLKHELESRGVEVRYDPERKGNGPQPLTTSQLASTIRTFQQHVKGGGLTSRQLRDAAAAQPDDGYAARLTRFLALYEQVAAEWEHELREIRCIDFDDMIIAAAEHIENGRYASPFKVILADEFQDSSRARVRLLKALLKNVGDDAHLCVVGDDWQGINRFAGADISVMTEFEKSFENSTRLSLNTTFRCPAALCEASGAFIQANPRQIKKSVATTNGHTGVALAAFASESPTGSRRLLHRQLVSLYTEVASGRIAVFGDRPVTVLILGRYNSDRPQELGNWQRELGDRIDLAFRTVHTAKGLEADYVMLLNVVEGLLGFPSQITDDPILQLAMPEPDPFPMAEERRLFYVALTRARRQVRIYATADAPSRFLLELAKSGFLQIWMQGGGFMTPCPKCSGGHLRRQESRNGPFEFCSKSPACSFKRNVDPESKSTAPPCNVNRIGGIRKPGEACPVCTVGTMVLRFGRFKPFLGCSAYPDCRTIAAPPEGLAPATSSLGTFATLEPPALARTANST